MAVKKKAAKKEDKTRLRKIELILKNVTQVNLKQARSFGSYNIRASSFKDWKRIAESESDPDAMRNVLYYGFQPLFDVLINQTVPKNQRSYALNALTQIMQLSVEYLTSYYLGTPNVKLVRDRLKNIRTEAILLDGSPYRTKPRNIDSNAIYPENIRSFLTQFFEHALVGKLTVPDYVVGCACGSSEIAMPLAGLLEADLDFIRRSFRRGDDAPKIVSEQEKQIKLRSARKKVLCIEDYVCSGRSLQRVMSRVNSYKPKEIIGASTNYSAEGNYLKVQVNHPSFKIFTLRHQDERADY